MEPFDLKLWPNFLNTCLNPPEDTFIDQVTIDSRQIFSNRSLFIALKGTEVDGHDYLIDADIAHAKFALVSEDTPTSNTFANLILLRVKDPLIAFQEIASIYRKQFSSFVIAIGGTHGKTMVKELLKKIIAKEKNVVASPGSYNSQIGVPLSLFTLHNAAEIALIEASVSKKGEMKRLATTIVPNATILTHIGKKHLITMGDLQTLEEETFQLSQNPSNAWSLLPSIPSNPIQENPINEMKVWKEVNDLSLPHAFVIDHPSNTSLQYKITFPDKHTFESKTTAGFSYYLDLINICIKAAWLLGISSKSISESLLEYDLEPIRAEIWKSSLGTTFINEPYASNAKEIELSFKHFDLASGSLRKIFIFSGLREKHENSSIQEDILVKAIARKKIDILYLINPNPSSVLKQTLLNNLPFLSLLEFNTEEEAFTHLKEQVKADDFVLIKGAKKYPLDLIIKNFNDSLASNHCFVNFSAIESNIKTIKKKLSPKTRMMVIVKAFAYGTDETFVGKFLHNYGIDILGVSYVEEAVALKRAGVKQAIFVINTPSYEIFKVVKGEFEVAVSDKEFIIALNEEAKKQDKKIKVHLHVDTGMKRLGCQTNEALELAKEIKTSSHLIFEGLMTHFSVADDPLEDTFTLKQATIFDTVIKQLEEHELYPNWIHAANSSAALRFNFPQYNMVRIGLAVYGLHSSKATKEAMELRLAISLSSRVVGINTCKKGDTISYGRTYLVEKDNTKIAVLPIGYFDGLHRNYSGKSYVMIKGQKAAMVGRICMDFMMVDVTDFTHIDIGDPVLIFGENEFGDYLAPENLANQGNSIVHELITCLGPRIERVFVIEEAF